MSFYANLMDAYLGKRIGPADILEARDKGWLTDMDTTRILDTKVAYKVDLAKKFKKKELSYYCNKNILDGVDVMLTDGKFHHFSLSTNDQINLNAKMTNILAGVEELEYHSDGEPCVYYSRDDMFLICTAAQQKVTYETTYFNCLVQWVNGCTTNTQVMNITYGSDVPEEYWSDAWRGIMEKAAAAIAEKEKQEAAIKEAAQENVNEQVEVTGGVNINEEALSQYEPMPSADENTTEEPAAEEDTKTTSKKSRKKKA